LLAPAVLAAGLVTLTSAQGGVFSGDNGRIAYTCGANICTVNADGTGIATLLTGASDPSWSSDESQIAYVTTGAGISVANDDGTSPTSLGAGSGSTQPTFSFDGNRVAYVKAGDIYSSLSNTGGAELRLTNTSTTLDADPAYSPTGAKIAFASQVSGGNYDIWTMNADGTGTPQQITSTSGDERTPTWSPNGQMIVFSAAGELWAVSSFGGTPTDLHAAGTDPAYSPDGTKIAFINASGNVAVMSATPSTAPSVTELDATGATVKSQPDWQALTPASQPGSSGPPVNVSYPTISLAFGDTAPTVGHFLSTSIGTWRGTFPITYTYQWKRCEPADPQNGQCFDIATARSSFYTPVTADFGKRLRVQVTATNSKGSASQNSEVTAPVTANAPRLRVTPAISGQNVVDQTLVLGSGFWDGSPVPTFTYSWRRCNPAGDFASCVEIPGATTSTYTNTVADIGFTLRVWITGTNVVGTDTGITNHTYPIIDKKHFSPSAVTTPTITGTIGVGRQLTGSIGSFTGDSPITTTFTWQRCDATGAACRTIPGVKKFVYYPTASDLGATFRLTVTAKNAYGTVVAMSDPSEPVMASQPHRRGRRIVGTQGANYLAGGGFDDVILGMGGNDTLLGGAGDDRIDGGAGNDVIIGGPGADKLFGGAGSDTIYAADGERDVIDCGDGADRAVVDSVDIVKNCEVVEQGTTSGSGSNPPPTTPTPTPPTTTTPDDTTTTDPTITDPTITTP
jgi:hypothetical protein